MPRTGTTPSDFWTSPRPTARSTKRSCSAVSSFAADPPSPPNGLLVQTFDGITEHYFFRSDLVSNDVLQLFEFALGGGEPRQAVAVEVYKDGTRVGEAVLSTPRVMTRRSNLIGCSNSTHNDGVRVNEDFRGRLGDVVIYNRRLKEDERLAVQDFMLTRWPLK